MSRKDWKNIFILLGSLSEKHKDVLISLVGLAVFTAVRPFITVVLTGMLVDAVYAGVDSGLLLRYVAVGVTGTFLMQAAEGVLVMFFNRKLEYMQEIQGQPLNRKSMAMDYEYLENVDVHETRQRLERLGGWSLMARVLSVVNKILREGVTVIAAVFVVVPMFIRGSHSLSHGFVGSWLMSVLLLAAVLLLIKIGRASCRERV